MQLPGQVWFITAVSRTGVLLTPLSFHSILQWFGLGWKNLKGHPFPISNTNSLRALSNLACNRPPSPPVPDREKKKRSPSPVRCDSAMASTSSIWSFSAAAPPINKITLFWQLNFPQLLTLGCRRVKIFNMRWWRDDGVALLKICKGTVNPGLCLGMLWFKHTESLGWTRLLSMRSDTIPMLFLGLLSDLSLSPGITNSFMPMFVLVCLLGKQAVLHGHISSQIFPSGSPEGLRLQPETFVQHLHDSLR